VSHGDISQLPQHPEMHSVWSHGLVRAQLAAVLLNQFSSTLGNAPFPKAQRVGLGT